MQLCVVTICAWHTILLLFCFLSPAFAAKARDDLLALYGMDVIQLDSTTESYYPGTSMYFSSATVGQGIKKTTILACSDPTKSYTPQHIEGTNVYIGCCNPGEHLSGSIADGTGLSCCAAGQERKGNANTGYACCAADKEVKGNAKTGKYLCCAADQDYSEDNKGGAICCPQGTHASGTIATGKYKCCPTGQDYSEDQQGTGVCCPTNTHASGNVVSGKYLCCDAGKEYTGDDSTTHLCCLPGQVIKGDMVNGYACCAEGQHVSGTVAGGQYLCCADGHSRTGSNDPGVGWQCCSEGNAWDGKSCKPVQPVCANGKQLVDGKCVCPPGQKEDTTGNCVLPPVPPPVPASPPGTKTCTSGIVTGKCYEMQNRNGHYWGWGNHQNAYTTFDISEESAYFKTGKFQFCQSPNCEPGRPINPNSGFQMKDLNGKPPAGEMAGYWLAFQENGNHINKAYDYSKAGNFALTKWPCGLYCLSGFPSHGISGSCPTDYPGYTFSKGDKQACIPIKLTEVPCDIRAVSNNCIWDSPKDQCCGGPVDCSSSVVGPVAGNAQKPLGN